MAQTNNGFARETNENNSLHADQPQINRINANMNIIVRFKPKHLVGVPVDFVFKEVRIKNHIDLRSVTAEINELKR